MFAKLISRFDDIPDEIEDLADRVTREGAQMIMNRARELVPSDSGELQRSLGVTQHKKGYYNVVAPAQAIKGSSRSGAYYGVYVEFGTKNRAATPFMGPAVDQEEGPILQRFKDELRKI